MRRWDRIASVVVLMFGAIMAFGTLNMDLGSLNQPGPGFLPLGAAALLVLLSLAYAASSFRRSPNGEESPWPKLHGARLIGVVASLALYCAVLSGVGYILATFVLMAALFLLADPGKWIAALVKAALSTAVTYFLFEKLLMVQFPAGLLGA